MYLLININLININDIIINNKYLMLTYVNKLLYVILIYIYIFMLAIFDLSMEDILSLCRISSIFLKLILSKITLTINISTNASRWSFIIIFSFPNALSVNLCKTLTENRFRKGRGGGGLQLLYILHTIQ